MKFKICETEIYISFLFVAVITLMIATDKTGLCLPTLFSVLIHESGHLLAMWICDCEPKSIRLVPACISISRGIPRKKYGEMFISVSGPAMNLIMFLSLYFNYLFTKAQFSFDCAIINFALFAFNLLPVLGLDGGMILKIILTRKTNDNYKADRTVRIITALTGIFMIVLGVTVLLNGKLNITVFIVGLYILVSAFLRC